MCKKRCDQYSVQNKIMCNLLLAPSKKIKSLYSNNGNMSTRRDFTARSPLMQVIFALLPPSYFSSPATCAQDERIIIRRGLERPARSRASAGEIPLVLTRRESIYARGHRLLFYAAMKLSLGQVRPGTFAWLSAGEKEKATADFPRASRRNRSAAAAGARATLFSMLRGRAGTIGGAPVGFQTSSRGYVPLSRWFCHLAARKERGLVHLPADHKIRRNRSIRSVRRRPCRFIRDKRKAFSRTENREKHSGNWQKRETSVLCMHYTVCGTSYTIQRE